MKLWDRVFCLNFLRRLGKFYHLQKKSFFFKNSSTGFLKRVSIEKSPTFLCYCLLLWPVFALPLYLQPSKKSVGEFLTHVFDFFSSFLKN